jgi:uncharacterized protein (DUF1499 family)
MSLALITTGIAALSLVLLALAGPFYRFGLLTLPSAFTQLRWAHYIGAVAVVLALTSGWLAHRRGRRLQTWAMAPALLGGLFAAIVPLQLQWRMREAPPIHDISTDLENPPEFKAVVPLRKDAPNGLERPAAVAEEQRRAYPDLAPVTLPLRAEQAFDRALAVAQQQGWLIVTADKTSGRLEATATTAWFGFEDDVVVRLTPWGAGTRVDVRSVSRVGLNDSGRNARRIRDYLAELMIED